MKKYTLLAMLGLFVAALFGQEKASSGKNALETPSYRAGEILVRLQEKADISAIIGTLGVHARGLALKQTVSQSWRIYLLGFDPQETDAAALLGAARSLPGIDAAQWNHETQARDTEPNDSLWSQQIDMSLINAPSAWDVGTGGLTAQGDTIVAAILEKGASIGHPDLRENMWVNWKEIPGDGLDNDGNGYIDDYRGWNPRTLNDDQGDVGNHGTAVHSIVGARGNNGKGVSGVNWNVKLLNIANVQFENEIIAAYEYVFRMRRMYNQSGGQKGAFIVASNASFGINDERADDHKIWCAMYDSLGSVGVLSAGATTNRDIDVDVAGDMPTSCASDYLIAVTNVDARTDEKLQGAGYGKTTIDLGAPGEGTFTARIVNGKDGYGAFPGTSAATPHVTGAIALLYSFDCAQFTADALTQPAICAQRVRDLIYESATPLASLRDISTVGGRLDLGNAAKEVRLLCEGSSGPLNVLSLQPNPTFDKIKLVYETPDFNTYQIRLFNMLGQLLKEETVTPPKYGRKTYELDAINLPRGIYVLSIGRGKTQEARKFIKN